MNIELCFVHCTLESALWQRLSAIKVELEFIFPTGNLLIRSTLDHILSCRKFTCADYYVRQQADGFPHHGFQSATQAVGASHCQV